MKAIDKQHGTKRDATSRWNDVATKPEGADPTDLFSLSNLQHRIAMYVRENGNFKISLAIAGGGGHLLSTLAATPSASKILLDGTVTYSREAFRDYLTKSSKENNIKKISVAPTHSFENGSFKYCSSSAAKLLATAACHRALYLSATAAASKDQPNSNWSNTLLGSAGVACTSVLQSLASKSHETYGSRAYCAVQSSSGTTLELQVNLSSSDRRNRFQEDVFVSHCILTCLELLDADTAQDIKVLGVSHTEKEVTQDEKSLDQIVTVTGYTEEGDELKIKFSDPSGELSVDKMLRIAAERVLSGTNEAVLIIPSTGQSPAFKVLQSVCLPPNSLVVPGSFNPPHAGHIALAKMAAESIANCSGIWFELSVTNVDKPALELETISTRLHQLLDLQLEMPKDICWGILLTDAPLFKQKVDLLSPLQVGEESTLHFSIGTDTLVRLIDPKYYNNSPDEMLRILDKMACQFVVGGRLDQRTPSSESKFLSGVEVLEQVPESLRGKFQVLPDFRVDLSSTEIRNNMKSAEMTRDR